MKNSRFIFGLIVLLALQLILVSCGGDKPEEPPPLIKKTAPPSVPAAKKSEQGAPEDAVMDYSLTEDMRNPFQTYIVVRAPKPDDDRIKTPLECCNINLFKVSVVISGIENPRALVLAPDGKRYAVKIGDRIGVREGKIVEIEDKSIIVEEILRDEEGNVATTDRVVLGLPDTNGEGRKKGRRATRGFGKK